ncbi:8431_t:CDS:1, partial [Acaulospora morrowiae]
NMSSSERICGEVFLLIARHLQLKEKSMDSPTLESTRPRRPLVLFDLSSFRFGEVDFKMNYHDIEKPL